MCATIESKPKSFDKTFGKVNSQMGIWIPFVNIRIGLQKQVN